MTHQWQVGAAGRKSDCSCASGLNLNLIAAPGFRVLRPETPQTQLLAKPNAPITGTASVNAQKRSVNPSLTLEAQIQAKGIHRDVYWVGKGVIQGCLGFFGIL